MGVRHAQPAVPPIFFGLHRSPSEGRLEAPPQYALAIGARRRDTVRMNDVRNSLDRWTFPFTDEQRLVADAARIVVLSSGVIG